MSELNTLPNIGKKLEELLNQAEISTPEELKVIGSKQALIKLSTIKESGVCLNMLYALEGAIQGIRWHGLSKDTKDELKQFYNNLGL
jgi:DNA transformation protein